VEVGEATAARIAARIEWGGAADAQARAIPPRAVHGQDGSSARSRRVVAPQWPANDSTRARRNDGARFLDERRSPSVRGAVDRSRAARRRANPAGREAGVAGRLSPVVAPPSDAGQPALVRSTG